MSSDILNIEKDNISLKNLDYLEQWKLEILKSSWANKGLAFGEVFINEKIVPNRVELENILRKVHLLEIIVKFILDIIIYYKKNYHLFINLNKGKNHYVTSLEIMLLFFWTLWRF